MTSKEFVIWLKGFTEGVHEFNVTPKQWDALKDKLAEVNDDNLPSFPFGVPNTTSNTPHPFPMWQQPHYPNPLDNPYKITCGTSGSTWTPNFAVTTTPGTTGYVTVYNPIQFSSGSYNPTTTTYGYPSGSAWSYTNGGNDIKD